MARVESIADVTLEQNGVVTHDLEPSLHQMYGTLRTTWSPNTELDRLKDGGQGCPDQRDGVPSSELVEGLANCNRTHTPPALVPAMSRLAVLRSRDGSSREPLRMSQTRTPSTS